jgi:hypothetical protein
MGYIILESSNAEKEGRTISNLVERIVLSALAATAEEQKQHQ